jgi:hypothetical protein
MRQNSPAPRLRLAKYVRQESLGKSFTWLSLDIPTDEAEHLLLTTGRPPEISSGEAPDMGEPIISEIPQED